MIISVSRRTDIPALYPLWLLNRLAAGFADVPNPISGAISRVTLTKATIDCLLLVTKNCIPLQIPLRSFEGYSFKIPLLPEQKIQPEGRATPGEVAMSGEHKELCGQQAQENKSEQGEDTAGLQGQKGRFLFSLRDMGLDDSASALDVLDAFGYPYGVQFSLTPYGKKFETALPDKGILLDAFSDLAERLGVGRTVWRYDPVIVTDELTSQWHIKAFTGMADKLAGKVHRCIISFVDMYKKFPASLVRTLNGGVHVDDMLRIVEGIAPVAASRGISLSTCSEGLDLASYGVQPLSCINREDISAITGYEIEGPIDKSHREFCACLESVDLGMYESCTNGCTYCYATRSRAHALARQRLHDPVSSMLIGRLAPATVVSHRGMRLLRKRQLSLF